jgi:hypothetical protein
MSRAGFAATELSTRRKRSGACKMDRRRRVTGLGSSREPICGGCTVRRATGATKLGHESPQREVIQCSPIFRPRPLCAAIVQRVSLPAWVSSGSSPAQEVIRSGVRAVPHRRVEARRAERAGAEVLQRAAVRQAVRLPWEARLDWRPAEVRGVLPARASERARETAAALAARLESGKVARRAALALAALALAALALAALALAALAPTA